MFEMHGLTNGFPYKTFNVYDHKKQNIYFICDLPHLIKTIRNCFARGNLWVSTINCMYCVTYNYSVTYTCLPTYSCITLQCNGQAIDWRYVVQLYEQNAGSAVNQGICLVPKIKYEHVHLTNFSKMRVDLAAQVVQSVTCNVFTVVFYFQVISQTVAEYLERTFKEDARETVLFIKNMDKLFDCFNVSSYGQGKAKRKVFQSPYRKETDFRLKVNTLSNHTSLSVTGRFQHNIVPE